MKTLEEILETEKARRHEDGIFGITACKQAIQETLTTNKRLNTLYKTTTYETSLFQLLETYITRANNDPCFNDAMILACWELINTRED